MDILTVYTKNGAVVGNYIPVQAAFLLDIELNELQWAIEEFGRCDSKDAIALPLGERYEPYDEWYARQDR